LKYSGKSGYRKRSSALRSLGDAERQRVGSVTLGKKTELSRGIAISER
jgi:hypothetical protein